MASYVVAGTGAVGARASRQLHSLTGGDLDLLVVGTDPGRRAEMVAALGPSARGLSWDQALAAGPDAVILAGADRVGTDDPGPGSHASRAGEALAAGAHVVSTAGSIEAVRALLELDARARAAGRSVVVGAGFSPGLSCLLARHAAAPLDAVIEVRVASTGAAGPACARRHLAAAGRPGPEWAGEWVDRPAGSGRELVWFPDPIGARDCYRGGLAEPVLLQAAFPGAERISARTETSRWDRARSRMGPPGLLASRSVRRRRPDPEAALGAVRVEVTGRRGRPVEVRVLGAIDRPGVAAGAVAALGAQWAVDGRLARTGAGGLGELVVDTVPFLRILAERGVRAATVGP